MNVHALKRQVRERDGLRCTDCGMTQAEHIETFGGSLDVHRLVPGSPYSLDGCVTVCRPCHCQKPKRPRGTVIDPNKIRTVISREVWDALNVYVDHFNRKINLRTERSSHVAKFIKEYLERRGHWPPQE